MFNIGDIVEALESSNEEYSVTTKRNNFIGRVVDVRNDYFSWYNEIKVHVIENKKTYEIGEEYWVEPQHFTLHKNNETTIRRLKGHI